jgi:hypothetical protein
MKDEFTGEEMFDGEFENEQDFTEEEIRKYLDHKYILVDINDKEKFEKYIAKKSDEFVEDILCGIELVDLEKLFDEFVAEGLMALFMPFELMNNFLNGENLEKLYNFVPVKGERNIGILIPKEEHRPKREEVINGSDVNKMNDLFADLESGKISFDDFIGSL